MSTEPRVDDLHGQESRTSTPAADPPPGSGRAGLLDALNPAQRQAVTHPGGPLLILAGAGSGKTRVITTRIAWLVAERGVPPSAILAITFTNKAARELRDRVGRLIPTTGAWIGTFHAMCARILRREIERLPGFTRDFAIYDTYDRNQLLKQLVNEAGYDPARFKPAAVGGWISDVKNGVRDAPGADDPGLEAEVQRVVAAAYEAAMRAHNALDFDDLLLKVRALFDLEPGLRDLYAQRFQHVLVDEYQDTNRVQYRLVRDFASAHRNLSVCGDPDQSIYAWRGADLRNILDFERDFAEPGRPVAVVRLEQNYRSTAVILRAAQGVIRHNRARVEKDLWSQNEGGDRLVARECGDEEDEAREIAHQLHAAIELGRRPDEIAVLYRVNFMQRALETALRMAGIPYQVVGGTEFYQRREIRDLVSYLVLAVNPAADLCCERVLNVPARSEEHTSELQSQ